MGRTDVQTNHSTTPLGREKTRTDMEWRQTDRLHIASEAQTQTPTRSELRRQTDKNVQYWFGCLVFRARSTGRDYIRAENKL